MLYIVWAIYRTGYCLFDFCEQQPDAVSSTFVSFTVGGMAIILTCRVWLLFYDLKHGEAVLEHEWWSTISDQQNWFIRHKNRYGSFKKFLWKPVALLLAVMCPLIAWANFAPKPVSTYSDAVILTFINTFWIALIILFVKMPKQYDSLLIRKEINRLVIYYAVSVVWYSVTIPLFSGTFWHFLNSFITYLFTIVVSAMVTLWPHFESSLQFKREIKHGKRVKDGHVNAPSATGWQVYVNSCPDDKNWNLFMRHLIKEIAVENLCFLLEIMQFKFQFVKEEDKVFDSAQNEIEKVFIDNEKLGWLIKLPNGLPTSSIIQNSNGNYIEQINDIYEKYIASDALLSINISYESRAAFMSDMNDIINFASENNNISSGHVVNQIELIDIDSNPVISDTQSGSISTEQSDISAHTKDNNFHHENKHQIERQSSNKPIMDTNICFHDTDIGPKLVKLFDKCMIDIHSNLAGSFHRFRLNQGNDSNQDIIDVMIKQQKN